MLDRRSHIRMQTTWLVLIDLACLLVSGLIAATARVGAEGFRQYVEYHIDGWLVFFGSVMLANYLAGSYRLQHTFSRFNLVVTWLFSLSFALLVISLTSYAWFTLLLGRGVLLLWVISYSFLTLTLKMLVYRRLFRSRLFLCRAVVLGAGPRAQQIRETLENPYVLPAHKVVAFVVVSNGAPAAEPPPGTVPPDVAVLRSTAAELGPLIRGLGVALIAIGLDDPERAAEFYPQLRRLRFEGMEVLMPMNVAELYSGRTPLELVNEEALTQATMESGVPIGRRVKRLFDIAAAAAAGVLLLPVAGLIALAIKLSAPRHPVFYTQLRVGQFGRAFRIYKFRTMRPEAEQATGPVWAAMNDARVTRLGRVLRRYRLDEIPQLVNVLKGEMSLVGPRPERPAISAELSRQIPYFSERENAVPGLTGWAQIRYPYGATLDDARRKLEYDLYYLKHASFSLDLQIILSTARIVLLGKEWVV